MTHPDEIERQEQIWATRKLLVAACEDAYTHLCILANALGEMTTESDVRILNQLEKAIRSAGGKVINHTGKVQP